MADCSSKHKELLDKVIAGVLQSDEDQEQWFWRVWNWNKKLWRWWKESAVVGDFSGSNYLHTSGWPRSTMMMTMQMKMIMLTVKWDTHCLLRYIPFETSFPRNIKDLYYLKCHSLFYFITFQWFLYSCWCYHQWWRNQ